jgi:polyisoprenoid-binding protein YceI
MKRAHALVASALALTSILVATLTLAAPRSAKHAAGAAGPAKSLLEGLELFQLDSPHSPIGFDVTWMGLTKVHGSFDDCLGTLVYDGQDLTHSSVSILARTPSLHTGSALRDKDLKGVDWFDVEKFPTAFFRSTAIVREGDGYRMHGSLTIHGVTREVEFPFNFLGRLAQADHEVRVGFEGRLTLSRRDFGLSGPARFNAMTELGKAMISDEVQIPLTIEGWRAGAGDTLSDRTADSLARRIGTAGMTAAAKEYRGRKAVTADSLMEVNESVLNTLGYALLERGEPQQAIQIFQLEAESYPRSAFSLTGLAQAYATVGDSARAIESGTKALVLNPNALRALEILRRLRRDSAG